MCCRISVRPRDRADAERQLVALLSAARRRERIDLRLAEGRTGEAELLSPIVLDLIQRKPVAEIDVEGEAELLRRHVEVRTQEVLEAPDHFQIRVAERDPVAGLRSLRPVEHATRAVLGVVGPSSVAAVLLAGEPAVAESLCPLLAPPGSCPFAVSTAMFRGELDVPCPEMDAADRDVELRRDLLHRQPQFLAQPPRLRLLRGLGSHAFMVPNIRSYNARAIGQKSWHLDCLRTGPVV